MNVLPLTGRRLLKMAILSALLCPAHAVSAAAPSLALDPAALAVVYSGQERMRFSVSWSGGVEIGELLLTTAPDPSGNGQIITARVTDHGLFRSIYPVDDTFSTFIGPRKLPRRYEVEQIERGRTVRRLTIYDQRKFKVLYRKQGSPPEVHLLDGPAHNEFSSFFVTRALRLQADLEQTVPAFVDKKRHLVPVKILDRSFRKTLFGRVATVKVQPRMQFKGLYDKDGDTVFWLTDDACRAPVEIDSKILVGSLVAKLTEYSNPACPLRPKAME